MRNSKAMTRKNIGAMPHLSLLREPITIPYMAHVDVDSPEKLRDACLFYATGEKNINMSRTITNTLREAANISVEKYEPAVKPKQKRPKKVEAIPHPRSKLFFGRGKPTAVDNEIKSIISRSRKVESGLDRTILELEALNKPPED